MPPTSIIKNLLFETCELTARVEFFIKSPEITTQSGEIIENYFIDELNLIKKSIFDKIKSTFNKLGKDELEEDEFRKIYLGLASISRKLRFFIDDNFTYVGSIPPREECKLLVDEIKKGLVKDLEFPIIPLSAYSFEIIEFREKLNALCLPKTDISNPLMWANLAHEIAHAIENISNEKLINKIKRDLDIPKDDIHYEKVAHDWIKELLCDFIALNKLYISYFLSFSSFSMKLMEYNIYSSSHPSNFDRLRLMYGFLSNNTKNNNKINKILVDEWDMIKILSNFSKPHYNPEKEPERKVIEKFVTEKFVDRIWEVIVNCEELENLTENLDMEFKLLEKLSEELRKKLPIGSTRKKSDEEIIKTIKNYKESKIESLYDVIQSFEETPNSPVEIINAAWICRASERAEKIDTKIFNKINIEKYDERFLEDFYLSLRNFDDLVLKSIEDALLVKIFKKQVK